MIRDLPGGDPRGVPSIDVMAGTKVVAMRRVHCTYYYTYYYYRYDDSRTHVNFDNLLEYEYQHRDYHHGETW